MRRYLTFLLLGLLLLASCNSGSKSHDEIKSFLTDWSVALTSKDESVRRFYDARFAFPGIFFEIPEGLHYTIAVDSMQIISSSDNESDTIRITVPFSITGMGISSPDTGTLSLTLLKTETGFFIEWMSQELAIKLKEYIIRAQLNYQPSPQVVRFDSVLAIVRASAAQLSKTYDSVVFFTEENDIRLFYVIRGNWENPFAFEKQRDQGDYKIGVVTADNKIIVPISYDKVYNPNGSFEGMIEVEKNGLRGLYRLTGEEFIPTEYEGIYPAGVNGVFAQVKQGEKFGWVDTAGKVHLDPASHSDKRLFLSPAASNFVLQWKFTYPGPVSLLINPYEDAEYGTGMIVYPSYLRDFGITDIAITSVMLETSGFGMGMTDNEISFEKSETITDKLSAFIAFFMESGADARGYQISRNDLVAVDGNMNKVDHLKGLVEDSGEQDPCAPVKSGYKQITTGLYESSDGHGVYNYFQVTEDGGIQSLTTVRQFNFTKFASIDESYFETCRYENLPYDNRTDGGANVVIIKGLSNEDLDVMRNEIFAEYGFIFKSDKWKTYFASKSWYKPEHSNVDNLMTEQDKKNVQFILEYQQQHKGMKSQMDSVLYGWAG